jgi:hypothetical protein
VGDEISFRPVPALGQNSAEIRAEFALKTAAD